MTEAEFQIVKSIGFVLALALAVGIQRLCPHRPMAGSWRSSGLWLLNAAILGAVCAGCACTVSRWASGGGVGLLNLGPVSAWVAIPISVLGMDLVSLGLSPAARTRIEIKAPDAEDQGLLA